MIQRILEREDEGHLRWTPAGIYSQLVAAYPDMYPPLISHHVLHQFEEEGFLEALAQARKHRFLSRIPAVMLANTLGRRIIDLVTPLVFDTIHRMDAGDYSIDLRELRMLLKDAIAMTQLSDETLGGKEKPEGEGKDKLTYDDVVALLAKLGPDRRQIVAQAIAAEIVKAAQTMGDGVIDGEAKEA